jgi:hypothetical protein
MTKSNRSNPLTISLQIPTYWTPEQAFAVFELIDELTTILFGACHKLLLLVAPQTRLRRRAA